MKNMAQKSQNELVAKMLKNRENTKNITDPIEANPLIENYKLQNQSYLQNQNTKRIASIKHTFKMTFLQNVLRLNETKKEVSQS